MGKHTCICCYFMYTGRQGEQQFLSYPAYGSLQPFKLSPQLCKLFVTEVQSFTFTMNYKQKKVLLYHTLSFFKALFADIKFITSDREYEQKFTFINLMENRYQEAALGQTTKVKGKNAKANQLYPIENEVSLPANMHKSTH